MQRDSELSKPLQEAEHSESSRSGETGATDPPKLWTPLFIYTALSNNFQE